MTKTNSPQTSRFIETEYKWSADKVRWEAFTAFFETLKSKCSVEELAVTGPDQYWRLGTDAPRLSERIAGLVAKKGDANFNPLKWRVRKILRSAGLGASVVRYRRSPNMHQLTVKKRLSDKCTKNREEADIEFLRKTPQEDIETFLGLAGYARDFTLIKKCQIYWVRNEIGLAVPVIYDIWRGEQKGEPRRFIEIEAEKGQSPEVCDRLLAFWSDVFRRVFELTDADREHLSLYEIYSGRRYIGA